jgi:hypothetical protein
MCRRQKGDCGNKIFALGPGLEIVRYRQASFFGREQQKPAMQVRG